MIKGGNATIFVTDFEKSLNFYTKTLGLPLGFRAGNDWAEVSAGSMTLGIHPEGDNTPEAGSPGSIEVGLHVSEPLDGVVNRLRGQGVIFDGPIVEDESVRLAPFRDPDGNSLYLFEPRNGH